MPPAPLRGGGINIHIILIKILNLYKVEPNKKSVAFLRDNIHKMNHIMYNNLKVSKLDTQLSTKHQNSLVFTKYENRFLIPQSHLLCGGRTVAVELQNRVIPTVAVEILRWPQGHRTANLYVLGWPKNYSAEL